MMELYLLNLKTEELQKLEEVYEEKTGVDCEKEIIQIAEKYKESLIEGKKLFVVDEERAIYRVTWASWSEDENKFYFDVAESDERYEFYEAYKRAFKTQIFLNKETLFSLMPTEIVEESNVIAKIEEQRKIIQSGKSFVSQLSINRFLHKKLADFEIEEILQLFWKLNDTYFAISENEFYFNGIDIDSFAFILEETFNLKDMYELDNFYIKNLLEGKDITSEVVDVYEEEQSFKDVLGQLVFQYFGMSSGDTPNLMLMLVVKKALLGAYLAERNVESLLNNQREIYDISILM